MFFCTQSSIIYLHNSVRKWAYSYWAYKDYLFLKIGHTFAFFHEAGYVLVVKERLYRSERGVASSFDASLNSFGPIKFGPGALFGVSCLIV